jgi:hypothetical protein
MFVERLRRKSESAGGVVNEFPTSLRLSQLCHGCGTIKGKSLSQRWHRCDCGIVAQRDLYSAFLAMCVKGNERSYVEVTCNLLLLGESGNQIPGMTSRLDRLNIAKARELWPRGDVEP